jgi:hypothetical protein
MEVSMRAIVIKGLAVSEIVDKTAAGVFKANPAKVFEFDDIRECMKRWSQTI